MLSVKIVKYLNHKLLLASKSTYYQAPEFKQALEWAYSIKEYLKYHAGLSDRDVAVIIKPQQQNLEKLLPCRETKSYESSVKNCEQIKESLIEIFKPKINANESI